MIRLTIDKAFGPEKISLMRDFGRNCYSAMSRVCKKRPRDHYVIHCMTRAEVRAETAQGGGAGYFDPALDRIAIARDLTPWRTIEVLCEEIVHAIQPTWSETIVRGSAVPAVLRGTIGYDRLPKRPGP